MSFFLISLLVLSYISVPRRKEWWLEHHCFYPLALHFWVREKQCAHHKTCATAFITSEHVLVPIAAVLVPHFRPGRQPPRCDAFGRWRRHATWQRQEQRVCRYACWTDQLSWAQLTVRNRVDVFPQTSQCTAKFQGFIADSAQEMTRSKHSTTVYLKAIMNMFDNSIM